jgi:hypothetical protein
MYKSTSDAVSEFTSAAPRGTAKGDGFDLFERSEKISNGLGELQMIWFHCENRLPRSLVRTLNRLQCVRPFLFNSSVLASDKWKGQNFRNGVYTLFRRGDP